jgi:hypothetical protein
MAATHRIEHSEFTVENLPSGYKYIPEKKQIYCEENRTYSYLNPDGSVKCSTTTYASVHAYVFMHQYVFQNKREEKHKESLSNENLIEINFLFDSKLTTTKYDLVWIISWVVILIFISAITPLFIQMKLNGV